MSGKYEMLDSTVQVYKADTPVTLLATPANFHANSTNGPLLILS